MERTELVESGLPQVRQRFGSGGSDPLSNSVPGQPGSLGYLIKRQLVAEVHPPILPIIPMLITRRSLARKLSRST